MKPPALRLTRMQDSHSVTGTTSWAVIGYFWRRRHDWRVFESEAGTTITDLMATWYLAAIIQSVLALALFPFFYTFYPWLCDLSSYLGDGSFSYEARSTSTIAHNVVAHELSHIIKESLKPPDVGQVFSFSNPSVISADRFRTVWNALVGRSTTMPEDLHIILANLLGFNAGYMAHSAPEPRQRMKAGKTVSRALCLA